MTRKLKTFRTLGSTSALLLGLLAGIGSSASSASADAPQDFGMPPDLAAASTAAQSSNAPVTVDDLTSETTKVVALPDGTFSYTSALEPVRAEVDGDWHDIDTALTVRNDGRLYPAVSTTQVSFSAGGSDALATVSTPSGSLALSWPSALPSPHIDNDTATYPDVLPGVDLAMTATADGYSQVLIVRNAQAAANPALLDLRLTTATSGLALQPTSDNTVAIIDGEGLPVLQNAAPIMWDSSTDPHVGGPATADDSGRGQITPLSVDVTTTSSSAAGQTAIVAVAPPRDALTGPGVDYPVFIDPPLGKSYGRAHWAEVLSNGWHYYDDSAWNPKIGYCGWANCNGIGTGRAYMQFDLKDLAGTGDIWIANADLYLENIHSSVCDNAQQTLLYSAGAINAQTAWPGPLGSQLSSNAYTYGDTCGGPANVVFHGNGNIERYIQDSYNASNQSVTFGLRAQDESDRNQWKQFSNAPANASANVNVLEFNFTYRPQAPTSLSVANSVTCNPGDGMAYTADPTPTFKAVVRDGYRADDSVDQNVTFKVSRYNGRSAAIPVGMRLANGQQVATSGGNGGNVMLANQTDGNLVLYARGTALWSTGTVAQNSNNYVAMQTDGNLVLYNSAGRALWSSKTGGHPGAVGDVQPDGNLVVYAPNGGAALWATATRTPIPAPVDSNADAVVVASGATAQWSGTRNLSAGSWVLTVTDQTNPGTSLEWDSQAAFYAFQYLPPITTTPTITSLDYPEHSWGPGSGSFHVDAGEVDNIAGFAYSWTGASNVPAASNCAFSSPQDVTAGNGILTATAGAVDIPLPSSGFAPGAHTLAIRSVDKAHHESPVVSYVFYSAPSYANAGSGKFEAETLAANNGITADPAGNQLSAVACDTCSGGQAERLGGSNPATFKLAVTAPFEADYAVGVWVVGGPGRGTITGSIQVSTGRYQQFGAPDASPTSGGFTPLSYDTSTAGGGKPTYEVLGGSHLANGNSTLVLNVTNGSILLDSVSLVPIANVTADSFAAALNNRGIFVANGAPADIANASGNTALSRTAMSPAYAAGATVAVNGLTFTMPTPDASVPESQRFDNLIMDGQTVRLHGVRTSSINLLVTSVCGTAPSTAATGYFTNYGTAAQPDSDSGAYDYWVTPAVPDWLNGSYSSPVTAQNGKVILKKAVAFSSYARGLASVAASNSLYTLQISVDPSRPIYSLTMPYFGNSFDCANPVVHALALSTS